MYSDMTSTGGREVWQVTGIKDAVDPGLSKLPVLEDIDPMVTESVALHRWFAKYLRS